MNKPLTVTETIHVFENSQLSASGFTSEALMATYVGALNALREQAKRKNPKPLTLEQLLKRDDKPVYVIFRDDHCSADWRIVAVRYEGICGPDDRVPFKTLGVDYDAYDHEPEDGK